MIRSQAKSLNLFRLDVIVSSCCVKVSANTVHRFFVLLGGGARKREIKMLPIDISLPISSVSSHPDSLAD